MSLLVRRLVEAEGLFAVRFVGNDGLGAALLEPVAQFGAVIGLIAEKFSGGSGSADQTLRGRTVVRFAAGQKDGKKTALSICDCVDFCISAAARATNRLLVLPLFAPDAERCALM